ncbi:MAG: serine esterase [Actinobacteria bacterium]|nr:serine esterase [Actinomycetota bacterium]
MPELPAQPVVVTAGSDDPAAPVVVLLHGRGSDENGIVGLVPYLPAGPHYVAVRGPLALPDGGYAWFANRGIGRPLPDSLRATMDWFRTWLDPYAGGRPVAVVGFSGGGAFAGGLLLDDPSRWAGVAVLFATVPFDAGVPVTDGRLHGVPVLVEQGDDDVVIPPELQAATWEYLTARSGALVTTHRTPGGHGIDVGSADVLRLWLEALLAAPSASG